MFFIPGKEKLLLIDGSSLTYRAFYALPLLQNRRGEHTNAVYGFTNMLLGVLEKEKPSYAAVVFDLAAPTFRHHLYREYKAHREETPDELGEQISRVQEILDAFNIPVFTREGYEADDILGSIASGELPEEWEILILTGDADLFQLISSKTRVLMVRKGITDIKEYHLETLKEEYGLTPGQLVDYRALKGDPSDNIPGVPGIGDKTARALLQEYGSLDKVLEAADKGLITGKNGQNLIRYREQAMLSLELARIYCNLKTDFSPENCRYTPRYQELRQLFEELEFKSLLEQIPAGENTAQDITGVHPLHTREDLIKIKEQFSAGRISMRIEIAPAYPSWTGLPRTIAFAVDEGTGYYFSPGSFTGDDWKRMLHELLSGDEIQVLGHDIKLLLNFMGYHGFNEPEPVFDSLLAAYLQDPGRSDFSFPRLLKDLIEVKIPLQASHEKDRDHYEDAKILALEARHLFSLREAMEKKLSEAELLSLYEEMELPLASALSMMERHGVKIDREKLQELSREIQFQVEELKKAIFDLAGEEFNLNSPKQLSYILFEKLQLPVIKKTKTGYSTDARVLEELAPRHRVVEKILYHRHLVKLEGTYLKGLLHLIEKDTGKIYTTFNQTVTSTGRLSSSDPNLQNIPVRLPEGRRIREAFIPSTHGYLMMAADYSQIELRVLAHLSEDPILVEAFREGEDIHRRTASEIFDLSPEEVTSQMRGRAKTVNFGIVYGISDYGLSQDLKISRKEAARYIENYFQRYRGVREYMENVVEQAREKGYVTTLFNRRRYLPEINSPRYNLRSFAERTARNTPIQGTAADIIKMAMLRVHQFLLEENYQAKMLLQVHDELILELPPGEKESVEQMVRSEMEQAANLKIPVEVDISFGENWYHLK